jgi:hypothetical protein
MTGEPCVTFNDKMLWSWAREIARIAQGAPHTPEQVADRVLAEVVTARLEIANDEGKL